MSQEPIADLDELLFRQVNPSFVRDGRPTSQAFRPTTKDEGHLSVARESITTAQEAFELFTSKGYKSAGTWAISVAEVQAQGLKALPDPLSDDLAHAVVDFRQLSKSQCEAKAVKLARLAEARGRLYPPPSDDEIPFDHEIPW